MKKILLSLASCAAISANLMAYDSAKAEQFGAFYSHMTQKACADSKLFVKGDEVMKMLRDKADFIFLDVRSEGESSVVAVSSSNSVAIPLSHLFEKANLDQLPADKPIIIVCHTGTRAVMAAMGLKQLGFKKTHVLEGGIVALAKADTPKSAPVK